MYRKLEVVPCARSWLPKSIWNFSPLKSSSTNEIKSGSPELYNKEGIQPFGAWHKPAKPPGKLNIGLVKWLVINLIGTLVWFKSLENQGQTQLIGVGAGWKNNADTCPAFSSSDSPATSVLTCLGRRGRSTHAITLRWLQHGLQNRTPRALEVH